MNRSSSSTEHSPMRKQNILFTSTKSSSSLLKSPTKRSDVNRARFGEDGSTPKNTNKRSDSDETRILRAEVEKYQMQLRMLEKETAEHRIMAVQTRERAAKLLQTYEKIVDQENQEPGVRKLDLTKLLDQIVYSAEQNTITYQTLDTHLKSMSSAMRSLSHGDFKKKRKKKENDDGFTLQSDNINNENGEEEEDFDIESVDATKVNDSVTRIEATTANMLRLSKHIMKVARDCVNGKSMSIYQLY